MVHDTDSALSLCRLKRKLHYFDLLWIGCTTQQIEVMEFALYELDIRALRTKLTTGHCVTPLPFCKYGKIYRERDCV